MKYGKSLESVRTPTGITYVLLYRAPGLV